MVIRPDFSGSFASLSPDSRVWIFQTMEALTDSEMSYALESMRDFLYGWKAHQAPLKADCDLLLSHFLVVAADESFNPVSGCAGDALHRKVQQLGEELGKDFFDRLNYPILHQGALAFFTRSSLKKALEDGSLIIEDLFLDNSVGHLGAWRTRWCIPLSESWLSGQLGAPAIR